MKMSMHISLTTHWEQFIEDKLISGRYKNASEIVREALRLLEERDEVYSTRQGNLRQAIQFGREGRPIDFNVADFKQLARKHRLDSI